MIRNTTTRDRHRRTIARGHPPCHICGGDIDYTASWLDPLSFTVDHLVPLNHGGLDLIENKAAAHRRCNRAKSDRLPVLVYVTSRTWAPILAVVFAIATAGIAGADGLDATPMPPAVIDEDGTHNYDTSTYPVDPTWSPIDWGTWPEDPSWPGKSSHPCCSR